MQGITELFHPWARKSFYWMLCRRQKVFEKIRGIRHLVLAEYGLPYVYPAAVEEAANRLSNEITAEEIAKRADFRNITTFTIDPVDAKDFDDALSIRSAGEGLWEVGVHIADVSHYVTEGSIIDKEAFKRATSIYLVDRTIPMLPEHLCNFLCSLRPNEEKLAYSVIFTMNEKAEVKKFDITRAVIKSDRRFTYEEVQEIIEKGEGEYYEEISTLNRLAQKMREKRFTAGAIDFQQAQVHFRLDDNGKPLSVYFSESNESHQLIEEFMLLANRTVAEKIGKKREYIAMLEKGETDMQLSTFIMISDAVGLKFALTY